jgi:hypothetical protein
MAENAIFSKVSKDIACMNNITKSSVFHVFTFIVQGLF